MIIGHGENSESSFSIHNLRVLKIRQINVPLSLNGESRFSLKRMAASLSE